MKLRPVHHSHQKRYLSNITSRRRVSGPTATSPQFFSRHFGFSSLRFNSRPFAMDNSHAKSASAPTTVSIEETDSHYIRHPGNPKSKILITCEHASNRFPAPYKEETALKDMHWAIDLGSEDASIELSHKMGAPALIARFSRLVIDVNRPIDSDTLFRDVADGKPVQLNVGISDEDKKSRMDRFYWPYRKAFDRLLQQYPEVQFVLSMHSYTPEYEGNKRTLHIGVLFTEHEDMAKTIHNHFVKQGYLARLNEPWTGSICDMMLTANKAGKKSIVIEFKQDLAVQPQWRSKAVDELISQLKVLGFV